ncbi:MAG: DIP1984 family protein [Clostridia bacterium]
MKLAEALVQRADIQKRLAQLSNRLALNARVQEGESTAEDPYTLLKELDSLLTQLEMLTARINCTNTKTIDDGETMTALLARRDCLRVKANTMRDFLDEASATVMRSTKSEVIIKSTVPVAELQKQVDATSKNLRDLDIRIQALNWTSELI